MKGTQSAVKSKLESETLSWIVFCVDPLTHRADEVARCIGLPGEGLEVVGRMGFVEKFELGKALAVRIAQLLMVNHAIPGNLTSQSHSDVAGRTIMLAQTRDNALANLSSVFTLPAVDAYLVVDVAIDIDKLHVHLDTIDSHDCSAMATHLSPAQWLGRTRIDDGTGVRRTMDVPG